MHPKALQADERGIEDDNEASMASRKLAENQESALAEQTHKQDATEEHQLPDRELSCAVTHKRMRNFTHLSRGKQLTASTLFQVL